MRKRQWKKILSVVLALAMVFSMNTAVFADEVSDQAVVEQPAAEAPAEDTAEEPAAPAEEPVAEAPAEEPAAEAPAEEPAAEEPAEEPAAEAPAEEEPAAEAIEEPTEEPAAEAPVEAPVEEKPEEAATAAGWDFTSTYTDDVTVSFIDASNVAKAKSAYVTVSEDESLKVSLNGIQGDGSIVLTSKKSDGTAVTIKKVYVSADNAAQANNIKGVVLSANIGGPITFAEGAALVPVDMTVTDTDKKIAPGMVYAKEGVLNKTAAGSFAAYEAGSLVYKNDEAKLSASYNGYTISLDKAVKNIYHGGNTTNKLVESGDYAAGSKIALKDDQVSKNNLYVMLANGDIVSVAGDIPAKTTRTLPLSVTKTTVSGIEFTLTGAVAGDTWTCVDGKIDDEDVFDTALKVAEKDWIVAKGSDNVLEGKNPFTDYTIIVRTVESGKMSAFASQPFTTADKTTATTWKAAKNWSVKGGSATLSVNETEDILSINGIAGGEDLQIIASENAAKIEKIYVNETPGSIEISANKTGVEIVSPYLIKGGLNAMTANAKNGDVVVGSKLTKVASSTKLAKGDKIYQAEELVLADKIGMKADYENTKIALSENGAIVGANGKTVDAVAFEKDKFADIDKFVASDNVIFKYNATSAKGYMYGVHGGSLGAFAKTDIEAPGLSKNDISKIKATYFEITDTKHANQEYAIAAEKADNFKALTYDVQKNSKLTTNTYKVVSFNKTTKLTPGTKYFVYAKSVSDPDAKKFTRFYETPVEVELGVVKNVVLTPRHDGKRFIIKGNDVSANDFIVTATADKDFDLSKEIDLAGLNLEYKLSGNELKAERSMSTKYTVSDGSYILSVSGSATIDDGKIKKDFEKNEYSFKYATGKFVVAGANSKLVVTTDGSYYYKQAVGDKTIGEGKYFVVTLNGSDVAYEASALDAIVSENAVSDTDKTGKPEVASTTPAEKKFNVKFYGKGSSVSSENVEVEVAARPVKIVGKYNFFYKTGEKIGDDTVAFDKLGVVDVETGTEVKDYVKSGAKLKVIKANSTEKGADTTQEYFLDLSGNLVESVAKDAESGNYIITTGTAEGYAFYALPIYDLTFKGAFKTATYDGKTISKNSTATIESDAAKKADDKFKKENAEKANLKLDYTAVVTVPTNVILASAGSKFLGWRNVEKYEDVKGATDTISQNTSYLARVKEAVPGFTSSENSLCIEFDAEDITYTGLKHVTDPENQVNDYAGVNGYKDAINKLQKNANAGSPDITLDVYVGDKLLVEGYDYKAVYKNNIKAYDISANKANTDFVKKAPQVTITFQKGYKSYPSVTKYFTINQAELGNDIAAFGDAADQRYYKKNTKVSAVKTGLINLYTGAALAVGKKKDVTIDIYDANDAKVTAKKLTTAGEYKVVATGCNNYTGSVEGLITVKDASDFVAVKLKSNKAKDYKVDYTTESTVGIVTVDKADEYLDKAITDAIKKNSKVKSLSVDLTGDNLEISPVKGQNYATPGAKKINYVVYAEEGESKVYVIKGTFQYTINKADSSKIEFEWDEVPEGGVPYVATGATLGYQTKYNGEYADISDIVTVKYSKNKKPDKEATAKVVPVKSSFVTSKSNLPQTKFKVGKAELNDANVKLAYVVKADNEITNDTKKQKAIAKRGSVVVKDDLGNILKAGKDYEIKTGHVNATESENIVQMNISGKGNFTGSVNIDVQQLDEYFLGNLTVKVTGTTKTFSPDEMKKLEEGEIFTSKIAEDHGIKLFNGNKAVGTITEDYDIVITPAAKGGKAFVTAVGVDGGKFGGSDVLAKKIIKVKVK